jgi:ATP/maltotriose-dependent transcriptional regulator MalT
VASIRANLAELRLEQGRLDEAETLFTRSFEVRDRLLHGSLFALASREGLARVAAARGDATGAEASLRQILEAQRHWDLPPGLPSRRRCSRWARYCWRATRRPRPNRSCARPSTCACASSWGGTRT